MLSKVHEEGVQVGGGYYDRRLDTREVRVYRILALRPLLTRESVTSDYVYVTSITRNYVTLRYVTRPEPGLRVTSQPWAR